MGKTVPGFQQELRGEDFPCRAVWSSRPRQRWQQLGMPGASGERSDVGLDRLPVHNALCKGAWGTGKGWGGFWMGGGGGGIKLCLLESQDSVLGVMSGERRKEPRGAGSLGKQSPGSCPVWARC